MSRTLLCSTLALSLSACVLVPVDSRTGLPINGPINIAAPLAPAAAPSSSVLTARLYPINEAAQRAGMLSAVIVDHHSGRGTISLGYLGETLQGEATRVHGHSRRGVANATGARGVSAQCDYELAGPGMGSGACSFSDGAQYRLHFGS